MEQPDFTKLESLFHALLEIQPGREREAAALRISGGDPDLARRALDLASADEEAGATNRMARQAASAPRNYGHFRTVRLIGSGGMGSVYLAERADGQFQQTVAVKVLAPHAVGAAFRERFLAERQILAGLNHPNITKLLDGGITDEDTPYLVMEYVEGRHLDDYCDELRMPLRVRVELFRKVCEPVSYAHRNLVVHRDLKPSNILVTPGGQPMLLDFGTAKILAVPDPGGTLPLLTLRYASPEQRISGPIATTTDVFSLGVILYELLTGAWPFGDPSSPQHILQRFARETPVTSAQDAVTEKAAADRSSNLRILRSSLAGDLNAILTKSLALQARDRYGSVQDLSTDLENWLAGRPVYARPAGSAYRAGKFLLKHWFPVAAAVIFVAALLASALYSIRQARIARIEARKEAEVNQFLDDMLSSASELNFDPQKFTVAAMLDAAATRLERSSGGDPAIEATLRMNLGSSYVAVQKLDQAKPQLEKALATFRTLGDKADEAKALTLLGWRASRMGAVTEARDRFHGALAILNRPTMVAPPLLAFRTRQSLAEVDELIGTDLPEGRRLVAEAIELGRREPSIPRADLAAAQGTLGAMLLNEGRMPEAAAALRESVVSFERDRYEGLLKSTPLYYLVILNSRQEDFTAAERFAHQYYDVVRKSIGPDHVSTAAAELLWARYRADTGSTKEAVTQVLEALPAVRKAYPPGSINLWTPLAAAAHVMNQAGRFAEAEGYARKELEIVDAQKSPEVDGRRAQSLFELGRALIARKKKREGLEALEKSAAIYGQLGQTWAKRAGEIRKMLDADK